MGIVDYAKSLRTDAVARLLPQRFVFHHVPKCGGTSVGRALRKRYILSQETVTPEESFRAYEAFSGGSNREQMLVDVLDLREQMLLYHMYHDVRGLSLHVRFSQVAFDLFGERYKFVTILRDPVARFISHYNWSYDKPDAHGRIDDHFEAFLDTPRAARIGATYVEYYCGLPKDNDIRSDTAVRKAIENLGHFSVIGDLADLQKFEADIQTELRVRVKIRHENKGSQDRKIVNQSALSDATMNKIHSLCAPDQAVWDAFRGKTAAT